MASTRGQALPMIHWTWANELQEDAVARRRDRMGDKVSADIPVQCAMLVGAATRGDIALRTTRNTAAHTAEPLETPRTRLQPRREPPLAHQKCLLLCPSVLRTWSARFVINQLGQMKRHEDAAILLPQWEGTVGPQFTKAASDQVMTNASTADWKMQMRMRSCD